MVTVRAWLEYRGEFRAGGLGLPAGGSEFLRQERWIQEGSPMSFAAVGVIRMTWEESFWEAEVLWFAQGGL